MSSGIAGWSLASSGALQAAWTGGFKLVRASDDWLGVTSVFLSICISLL